MSTAITVVEPATLDTLAGAIRDELAEAEAHYLSAAQHAANAGDRLIEAKGQCQHGTWIPWLKANVPTLSQPQASRFMRLARARVDGLDLHDMSIREGIRAIGPSRKPPNNSRVISLADAADDADDANDEPETARTETDEPETLDAEFSVTAEPVAGAPDEPWTRLKWHLDEARRLIEGFIATASNPEVIHPLRDADDRIEDVADLLGYSPTMLYVAAELVVTAEQRPMDGGDE